jgi:hypothetical protein
MRQPCEPLAPFLVVGMPIKDTDDSRLNVTQDWFGNFIRTTKRCQQRARCASKIMSRPVSDRQTRTLIVRRYFAIRLVIVDAMLDHGLGHRRTTRLVMKRFGLVLGNGPQRRSLSSAISVLSIATISPPLVPVQR